MARFIDLQALIQVIGPRFMKTKVLTVAALLLAFQAAPVRATVVTVTYGGTIIQENAPPPADINWGVLSALNDTYVATFVFDTALGATSSSPTETMTYGGSYFSVSSSPLLSASLVINDHGVNRTVLTNASLTSNDDLLKNYNDSFLSEQMTQTEYIYKVPGVGYATNGLLFDVFGFGAPLPIPASNTVPFSYAPPTPNTFMSASYITYENGLGYLDDFEVEGSVSSVLVATTPLPATLPLFATGLGGLGLLGWRRKRKARLVT